MLNIGRILSEHRPVVVLAALVLACAVSLVRGTESSLVRRGVMRVVTTTAYPFQKARKAAADRLGSAYRYVADYEGALAEAARLRGETAKLKLDTARLAMLERENARLREMARYLRETPRLTLEPASILETYKGMLRIDRGSRHGVRPATCVVGPQGVVGVVTETADFTSTVATLHHVDCRIGAMVLRNRVRAYDGVVQANGSDFNRICTMEYIDMKEDIRPGDVVVTSPESLFPPGLLIGRIGAVHDGGALWKSAEVVPAVDPYAVDEVFLIRRAVDDPEYVGGPAGDFLDLPPAPDAAASRAPETPDTRPLQERYAP